MTEIEPQKEVIQETEKPKTSFMKRAKRSQAKIKMGIGGVSGGGKTYSALLLADGLVGLDKTVVIDTENGSANLYSDIGEYSVLPFTPPYNPQRFVKAIQIAVDEGFQCIIIDSMSAAWEGTGGILDIHNKYGGKFSDWAKVMPLHKEFIDAILQAPVHIIVTMRKKQDYAMVEKSGKMVVEKMGLKEIQKDGTEYDLTLNFDIDINHCVTSSKDRTGLFVDKPPFKITRETGLIIKKWTSGEPTEKKI
ncbi:MAG: hypothetical protein BWY19_00767 [bacterium ADurb.Bin212]|nr:MAG: hypothetical protein BWY19_00767 [bacterium ADurb.Bin212]